MELSEIMIFTITKYINNYELITSWNNYRNYQLLSLQTGSQKLFNKYKYYSTQQYFIGKTKCLAMIARNKVKVCKFLELTSHFNKYFVKNANISKRYFFCLLK